MPTSYLQNPDTAASAAFFTPLTAAELAAELTVDITGGIGGAKALRLLNVPPLTMSTRSSTFELPFQGLFGTSQRRFVQPPPPINWRNAAHQTHMYLMGDKAEAQYNAFRAVFFSPAGGAPAPAPAAGGADPVMIYDVRGTTTGKFMCAVHVGHAARKAPLRNLFTGGIGEGAQANKEVHRKMFEADLYAMKRVQMNRPVEISPARSFLLSRENH